MNNFIFYSPTKFIFGKDTEKKAPSLAKEYGATKVLLLYGGSSALRSGLLARVKRYLEEGKLPYIELGGVEPNPKDDLVYVGIEKVRDYGVDFILALGGGSVIDTAKAIAAGAVYDGDFWDFYSKKAAIKQALPLGVILTIAAAGSEASDSSVITKKATMEKRGSHADIIRPVFSILNPMLTMTVPPDQTFYGVMDMMSHILERYFSYTEDVDLTSGMCEAVLSSIILNARILLQRPKDYGARANLMWAGTMAHSDILGVGREQDWGSHSLGHELSSLYGAAHGATLAVVFPAWLRYALEHNSDITALAELAINVWGAEFDGKDLKAAALSGIQMFVEYLKELNLPTTLEELGGRKEDIPVLMEKVILRGNYVKLTRENVRAIYTLTLAENRLGQ